MSGQDAYVVAQEMPASAARHFQVPFHYLVYAERGTMTLESGGRRWTLPPARAGLVAAGHGVQVALPRPVTICSALFAPDFAPPPPAPLAVFEMSGLARELLFSLRGFGEAVPLDDYARPMFRALAAAAWRLSERPTPAVMPVPESPQVARALALTEAGLDEALSFEGIAGQVVATPRTLARRFMSDIGMTWREAQRRLRMIRAVELLSETPLPVTEVAMATGYSSLSAFNAAFRDFTGQTPTVYRAGVRSAEG